MPRKAAVTTDEAVLSLKKFIFHLSSPILPAYSAEVWDDISKDLENRWSRHHVFNSVKQDRNGILTRARSEKGIVIPLQTYQLPLMSDEVSSIVVTTSEDSDESQVANDKELFAVNLTSEEWNAIKPSM